mmetsp:Transcript_15145/g.35239  ORF Transcript_15145/g.35239 Transcript_15145/m.35239 type:complete len:254 (+) Transcript_15145:85-846(+)
MVCPGGALDLDDPRVARHGRRQRRLVRGVSLPRESHRTLRRSPYPRHGTPALGAPAPSLPSGCNARRSGAHAAVHGVLRGRGGWGAPRRAGVGLAQAVCGVFGLRFPRAFLRARVWTLQRALDAPRGSHASCWIFIRGRGDRGRVSDPGRHVLLWSRRASSRQDAAVPGDVPRVPHPWPPRGGCASVGDASGRGTQAPPRAHRDYHGCVCASYNAHQSGNGRGVHVPYARGDVDVDPRPFRPGFLGGRDLVDG